MCGQVESGLIMECEATGPHLGPPMFWEEQPKLYLDQAPMFLSES